MAVSAAKRETALRGLLCYSGSERGFQMRDLWRPSVAAETCVTVLMLLAEFGVEQPVLS